MTAREIQQRLIVERYRRSTLVPNYTPRDWWECDVFEVTKSGFFVEYEVKLSKGDYEADRDKRKEDPWKRLGRFRGQPKPDRLKHTELVQGDVRGPARFFYVVPDGLLTIESVPPWAGLIIATENRGKPPWSVQLQTVKAAPKLHNQKINPELTAHAKGVLYYRFHNLFLWGTNSPPVGEVMGETVLEPTFEG